MKIYTKTGDKGSTSLWGGKRVLKSETRINAYGTVDELNSWIGVLASFENNKSRILLLNEIQNMLFVIGSHLAADPEKPGLKLPAFNESLTGEIEKMIDEMEASLPTLTAFILPGGNKEVSFTHVARCVCRRAERDVVELSQTENIDNKIIIFLNRLSDFLFVLARKTSDETGASEIQWKHL